MLARTVMTPISAACTTCPSRRQCCKQMVGRELRGRASRSSRSSSRILLANMLMIAPLIQLTDLYCLLICGIVTSIELKLPMYLPVTSVVTSCARPLLISPAVLPFILSRSTSMFLRLRVSGSSCSIAWLVSPLSPSASVKYSFCCLINHVTASSCSSPSKLPALSSLRMIRARSLLLSNNFSASSLKSSASIRATRPNCSWPTLRAKSMFLRFR
mmetsp:Transcript_12231/g.23434  ORF Transcript_12231/g.23434 Transcript_12231/m.23434 type:complete len:215 (+) Transcript_12231:344-988(+)